MNPLMMYMDHGDSIELAHPAVAAAYKAYEEQTTGKRRADAHVIIRVGFRCGGLFVTSQRHRREFRGSSAASGTFSMIAIPGSAPRF
jgi:hypothetical protein